MKKTEIYICSTVNSIKAVDGYGTYLLVYKASNGQLGTMDETCELKKATKTTSELMLVAQALERYREPCEITIHVRVSQTVTALSEWMPAWRENEWKNSRGEEVSPWYKAISERSEGHIITYTADRGEFSNWLEDETRRRKEKKKCLISLENLAARKSSTQRRRA